MGHALFSVIVPIYKVEKYLNQCVDSILGQTFTDFELILVDDGSPDNCPKICDEYAQADERVKVIHKENGGVVETRKVGVQAATGDYIVCVDGDDWVEENYLESFAEIIRRYQSDVICCGYYLAYDTKNRKEVQAPSPFGEYTKEKIEQNIFPYLIEDERGRYFAPMLWAKTYKRELYLQNQQTSGRVSVGEDHACTKPCIYRAQSMYILDKYLYNYRQNPSSVTKSKKAFLWEGPKEIAQHFEKHIDMGLYDFQMQVYRSVVHNLFNVAVSQFNREEPYKLIKRDILEHIADPYYQEAIKKCTYKKNWKGTLAKWALKHKCIFLMYIFCKL